MLVGMQAREWDGLTNPTLAIQLIAFYWFTRVRERERERGREE